MRTIDFAAAIVDLDFISHHLLARLEPPHITSGTGFTLFLRTREENAGAE